MSKKIETSAAKYKYLTVIDEFKGKRIGRAALWNCLCICGNHVIRSGWSLRSGESQSCGCIRRKEMSKRFKKHGHATGYSPEYRAWHHMKERCYNEKDKRYHDYGGRGISVCDRWMESFENFLSDMGLRPSKEHSLDRYPNNDGNYELLNCRWATRLQQMNGRRNTVFIEYEGNKYSITDLAAKLGRTREWVRSRFVRNTSPRSSNNIDSVINAIKSGLHNSKELKNICNLKGNGVSYSLWKLKKKGTIKLNGDKWVIA